MSAIKEIARKIPDEIRAEILSAEDPITVALPNQHNPQMMFLAKVWYEFIETNKEFSPCTICLNNILTSFRQMKNDLVILENEKILLDNLNQ